MGGGREKPGSSLELWGEVLVLHRRLAAMGVVEELVESEQPDEAIAAISAAITTDAETLRRLGIATPSAAQVLAEPSSPSLVEQMVRDALAATEQHPLPAREWPAVLALLEPALTATLVGTTTTVVQRYTRPADQWPTPAPLAARLHFVALVNGELAGSYTPLGIRHWWQRSHVELDGHHPGSWLGVGWSPSDERARQLRALAATLAGPGLGA